MPQRLVAIDYSSHAARMVVAESTFRSSEITSISTLPRNEEESMEDFLRRVVGALPEDTDSVVITAEGNRVSTRRLTFPFADVRKVEAALDFEVENLVPYDAEDIVIAWHVVERTGDSTEVLAAVIPKVHLIKRLGELSEAGTEPRSIVLGAGALAELEPADNEDCLGLLSLGSSHSHLAVVKRGLRFARTLRFGGNDVDRSVAKLFNLDLVAARDAREREGRIVAPDAPVTDDVRKVSDAVESGLNQLVANLTATFKALPEDETPTRIRITGGFSQTPGLPEYLERALGIPVEILHVRSAVAPMECRPKDIGAEYAVCIATALSALRRGSSVPLNLRRGEFAYQGDLQLYRGQFTRIAVGLAAIIALAILGSIVRYTMVSAEEEQIDEGFCVVTEKIVGRRICNPTAALAAMKTPGAADGIALPAYSAARLLEAMSRAVPSDLDVEFRDLEIKVSRNEEPDRITGKGETTNFEATELLVAQIKRGPCVKGAEVTKLKKTRDGSRVEFQLSVESQCPPGVIPGEKLAQVTASARPPTPNAIREPAPEPEVAPPPAPPPTPTPRATPSPTSRAVMRKGQPARPDEGPGARVPPGRLPKARALNRLLGRGALKPPVPEGDAE